jgi:Arc/MetJ-type ribon-helix-helix transcriptional regulator
MASITVGFSIPEEEQARLDHLVEHFAQGNRSAFLRLAMKHMEVLKRAEQLRDLQTYGVHQRTDAGLDDATVEDIVHRVLSKRYGA